MLLRFAGFELDPDRAELRRPGGEAIKLRPKTLDVLALLTANPGRVLSKQELMEAVWPDVHVGDDSLFQCIREIRAALEDGDRKIVKLVTGRGYLFDAEVSTEALATPPQVPATDAAVVPAAVPAKSWRPFGLSGRTALAAVAAFAAAVGLAIAAPMFGPDLFKQRPPGIAVMPINGSDAGAVPTAAAVTTRLTDGLAKIENIRLVTPEAGSDSPQAASARPEQRIAEHRLDMGTARPPDPDRNPGSDLVGAGFGRDRRDGLELATISARGGPRPSAGAAPQ